ncbi:citrate lyase holo-[acyl-carrier protein] synthase [Cohaesibacter intestini]|uniref:citrate lyase holo-[acyl-carrier protein] synthase n=1 Tax=Cohaesibacter intestini TaxID=2211145 RepID=UPI00130042A7|nr:citrate lyase holo-[acyl-carrier protein] synthase [Cohaesibacter intestini]
MTGTKRDGIAIDLQALLASRDARAARRASCLAKRRQPTITLTLVMPGPVKDSPLIRTIAEVARHETLAMLARRGWGYDIHFNTDLPTGPESLYQVDGDAALLKRALVALEDNHPLGRLWDLDVHDADGQALSRSSVGDPPRRCLVCDADARACGRSRTHALDELWSKIETLYDQWLGQANPD